MSKVGDRNNKTRRVAERAENLVLDAMERAERNARGEPVTPPVRRATNPKRGRTPAQRATDQYVAVQLSVQGYTTEEIARAIGITPAMVTNDLVGVNKHFRERASEAVEEHRGRHLMMTDSAITDLWRAWRASKRESTVTTTEVRRGAGQSDGAASSRGVTKRETKNGDVNYIFGMAKMMERNAKLAGLDKPVEAKVYVEQARETLDRVANALAEELHAENPELLERLMNRIAEDENEPITVEAHVTTEANE